MNDVHTNGENEKRIPKSSGVYTKTAGDIIQSLRNSNGDVGVVMEDPNTNSGASIQFNPLDGEWLKIRT